ncbi:MBL fold metallo-hydrolase [Haloarchaeobius amylolyticus]|uniref:MBL fold metallo-hydrolase n=1 Tax=Haloarchaeobius amylolyticus TaxID=1198296 RepID=UPI00226D8FC9|nr:MBL fold metallo-hydrolase [Haloarchaeobius amylolyticus]
MIQHLSPETFRDMQDSENTYALIDTRGPESYESWHVPGAVNHPFGPDEDLEEAERRELDRKTTDTDTAVTICAKGITSETLAEELDDTDAFDDVYAVEDGMRGWSQVYDVAPVRTGDPEIYQVQRRAKGCLGYVVGSDGEAAVVDPTRNTEVFRTVAENAGLEVTHVLDTHVHADHLSGGRDLADELGVPYHLGSGAQERGVEYEYEPLDHGDTITVGDTTIEALHTPGHTSELLSYRVEDEAVMTADTLFVDSTGRTELEFDADAGREGARQLYESLSDVLLTLPDDVTVLPGHVTVEEDGTFASGVPGEAVTTTIGGAKDAIDVLDVDEASFVETQVENLPEKPPNYETIIDVNRGKATVDDEERAVDLELGPNNCAA